nr:monocarboxylate transporter 12 [Quercus suber]
MDEVLVPMAMVCDVSATGQEAKLFPKRKRNKRVLEEESSQSTVNKRAMRLMFAHHEEDRGNSDGTTSVAVSSAFCLTGEGTAAQEDQFNVSRTDMRWRGSQQVLRLRNLSSKQRSRNPDNCIANGIKNTGAFQYSILVRERLSSRTRPAVLITLTTITCHEYLCCSTRQGMAKLTGVAQKGPGAMCEVIQQESIPLISTVDELRSRIYAYKMSQTATITAHELETVPPLTTVLSPTSNDHTSINEEPEPGDGQSLPPHDSGIAAWRLLLSVFVFEALLWGFPLSFGVFQNYYSHLPQFQDDPFVSTIGTVASGLTYLAAPIIIPFIKRFARWRRRMILVGWPLCLLGLVAGSFATTLGTLVLTQGVMYGLGFTIFYYPIISMVNEYWIARRGMAYGILCAASGVSGAVFPLVIERLLARYGYQTTLRCIAVGLFVLTGPLIPTLKGRLPESETSAPGRTDWSFLKTSLFWVYSASNLAMGLGYFFPSLYLPSFAKANGLSSTQGALLLAIMSISQVLGQMTFGYLSDRKLPLDVLTISSPLVAGIAGYTCWGLAHSFAPLAVFAVIYGFFGAGYTALWGRMGTKISSEPSAAFTAFGLLNFGKGIGNVLAGPIGGSLLRNSVKAGGYGTGMYEKIVLFTGSAMVLSAVIIGVQDILRVNPNALRRYWQSSS